MPKVDLDKLTMKDLDPYSMKALTSAKNKIEKALVTKQKQEEREFYREMKARARKRGLDFKEIIGQPVSRPAKRTANAKSAPKAKRAPVKPKYQNPKDPDQTWTGRGRAPAWAKPYKDRNKLEQIAIKK